MADVLDNLKRKLLNIPIEAILEKIVEDNKAQIEDKNIEQLQAGLGVDGLPLEPPYSPFTVEMKKSLGEISDRVTLQSTGKFYKGIEVDPMNGGFEMQDSDSKWGMLTEKYGTVIGLTDKSKSDLREDVFLPNLIEEVHDYFAHA